MNIKLVPAENSKLINNLFQYYIYDMSEYTKFSPNDDGTYIVDNNISKLSDYWNLPDHYPFLITIDDEVAGFSLLRKFPFEDGYFDIGQFFVLRKFKNLGVGKKAFELSVKKFPGKWITRVLVNNIGAMKFWEKVINEIADATPRIEKKKYNNHEMYYFYYSIEK